MRSRGRNAPRGRAADREKLAQAEWTDLGKLIEYLSSAFLRARATRGVADALYASSMRLSRVPAITTLRGPIAIARDVTGSLQEATRALLQRRSADAAASVREVAGQLDRLTCLRARPAIAPHLAETQGALRALADRLDLDARDGAAAVLSLALSALAFESPAALQRLADRSLALDGAAARALGLDDRARALLASLGERAGDPEVVAWALQTLAAPQAWLDEALSLGLRRAGLRVGTALRQVGKLMRRSRHEVAPSTEAGEAPAVEPEVRVASADLDPVIASALPPLAAIPERGVTEAIARARADALEAVLLAVRARTRCGVWARARAPERVTLSAWLDERHDTWRIVEGAWTVVAPPAALALAGLGTWPAVEDWDAKTLKKLRDAIAAVE